MNRIGLLLAAGAMALCAGSAGATPVTAKLVSTVPSAVNVKITATPSGTTGNKRAVAQLWEETTTNAGLGSFVAWCLDLAKTVTIGSTYGYTITDTPYTNSFGLSGTQQQRVQAMFDANYDSVFASLQDTSDPNRATNAAAFQLALWEAAFERDQTTLNLATGQFKGEGLNNNAITSLAGSYVSAALAYLSGDNAVKYDLTFLQSGQSKKDHPHQNIVTASPIPLPAAAWLLIGGLGVLAAVRRRGDTRA